MEEVKLLLDDKGRGAFVVREGDKQEGEMVVSVSGSTLTVYHTEVAEHAQGRGLAQKLLDAMVGYARERGLKVRPLCPYVHARFRRHPEAYADIWNKEGEGERH